MVKEVLIPWQEIQGVDTVDIEAGYWSFLWFTQFPTPRYNTWVARDVTVILLPKPFYDRRIFVDSPLLRGPGWKANFIPKGSLVQMALAPRTRLGRTAGAARSGRSRAGLHFAKGPPARRREPACQA